MRSMQKHRQKAITLFRIIRSYIKVKVLNKPAPVSMLINITNRCPKGCVYCDSWKHPPMDMPYGKVLKLLKQINTMGIARITFHGGEPLMHPDFGKIIQNAAQYNLFTTISVRETLVKKHIKHLKNLDMVFVSFDGTKKAHDAHKGKGSYKDLIPALEALKKHDIPFQTTTVVTKFNLHDIDFILNTAKEYDFQAHFQPLQYTPNKKTNQSALTDPLKNPLSSIIPSSEEYAQVGLKLLEQKKNKANIATSPRIIKLLFIDWPNPALTFLPYKLDKSIKCWAGLLYNNISVTGELFPCSYYNPSYSPQRPPPNVFKLGLKQALRKIHTDNRCQTCMIPCYMELNAMFSLDIMSILNWMPKVFCRHTFFRRYVRRDRISVTSPE